MLSLLERKKHWFSDKNKTKLRTKYLNNMHGRKFDLNFFIQLVFILCLQCARHWGEQNRSASFSSGAYFLVEKETNEESPRLALELPLPLQ